jgi:hypothetical protein
VIDHPAHALGRAAEHHAAARATAMVHVAHPPPSIMPGDGGAGCADAARLSTASSETSIPSITILTRLALVVAITVVFVISSLLCDPQ